MSADAIRLEMRGIVCDAVGCFRVRGSAKAAVADAARFLGISPRRVEAYLWREVRMVPAWEADALRSRKAMLEAKRARIDAIVAETDALLAGLPLEHAA